MPTIYKEYCIQRKREQEELKASINKQKEEHIKSFISNQCEITSNHKDRIQSKILYDIISNSYSTLDKINPTIIKTIILRNEGILHKKTNGCMVYCGLKVLDEMNRGIGRVIEYRLKFCVFFY